MQTDAGMSDADMLEGDIMAGSPSEDMDMLSETGGAEGMAEPMTESMDADSTMDLLNEPLDQDQPVSPDQPADDLSDQVSPTEIS